MALRTDLDLALARALAAARRVAGRRVDAPADAAPLVQLYRQPLARIGGLAVGPRDVRRAGAVTRFAADRDLVPVRREGVLGRVVAFGDLARVTVRAHEVPVLRAPRPVQFVAEIDLLVRVLPEPALAAGFLGPRIPGQRERLQAPARQLDQVLLQRLDAEGVLDLEVGELAVGAVGADEELAVAREEVRCNALVGELRVAEVAAHGLRGRVLHGARVLRRGPCGVLLRMTGLADRTAGKARDDRCCDGGAWRWRDRCARQLPRDRGEQKPGRECGEHPGPARRRASLAALVSRRRRGDRSGGRAVGLALLAHRRNDKLRMRRILRRMLRPTGCGSGFSDIVYWPSSSSTARP